jgi:hypothetical protein
MQSKHPPRMVSIAGRGPRDSDRVDRVMQAALVRGSVRGDLASLLVEPRHAADIER